MATGLLALAAPAPEAQAGDDRPFSLASLFGVPDSLALTGSLRVRQELLDGQYRPGLDAHDDLFSMRTTLQAEWTHGPWRIGGELYDSRVYGTEPGRALTPSEVNTLEPVQVYVAWDGRDVLGKDSTMTLQAGRFAMNLGSRRLVSASNIGSFGNTTTSYTGLRTDFARAGRDSLTLYYTLPPDRLPSDSAALRANKVKLDRESRAQRLWGVLAARQGLPLQLTAEVGYAGLRERDTLRRATRDRDLHSLNMRLIRDPEPGNWDYEFEAIRQTGSISASAAVTASRLDVAAHFVHADAGYSFDGPWHAWLSLEYDHASGDDPGGKYTRFDTLFGARRGELGPSGLYGLIGRTNLETIGVRLEIAPTRRTEAFATWHALWAAAATDSFSTSTLRDPSGATGRFAGHQLDMRLRHWLIPQTLQADITGTWLIKEGLTRNAPNASPHGDTHYLSAALQLNF